MPPPFSARTDTSMATSLGPISKERSMRQILMVAAVLVLTAAGCLPAAGQEATPAVVPSVPQLTAIVVSALGAPVGVLGSDGQEHLEYDLLVTNAFSAPVTLTAVDVVTPDGTPLLR